MNPPRRRQYARQINLPRRVFSIPRSPLTSRKRGCIRDRRTCGLLLRGGIGVNCTWSHFVKRIVILICALICIFLTNPSFAQDSSEAAPAKQLTIESIFSE